MYGYVYTHREIYKVNRITKTLIKLNECLMIVWFVTWSTYVHILCFFWGARKLVNVKKKRKR